MRIGIDAKWFYSGNPSGRNVVRSLLQHLLPAHAEHEFFIFLKRRDRHRPFPYSQANVHLEYVGGRFNLFANLVSLARRGHALRLDAVVFQYFAPCFSRFLRVVYIHDAIFKTHPVFFSWRERCYFLPMRFLARRAHLIITVSQAERRRLEALGFAGRGRIEVIANGVRRAFRPAEGHDREKLRQLARRYDLGGRFLLYVGRMNPRKNIPGLLDAFARIGGTDVQLILAGVGRSPGRHFGQALKKPGLSGRVRFIGWIPDEELPLLYALARGFAYLSFAEGFGLPALEALASGVPAVVSDIDVMHEVCGDAALFVDPNDPAAIAACLRRVIADEALRRELRSRGLAQAAKFTWDTSVARLLDLVVDLQASKPFPAAKTPAREPGR